MCILYFHRLVNYNYTCMCILYFQLFQCTCMQGILYKFPCSASEENSEQDLLVQLKGVFLTLSDIMGTITECKNSWYVT